MRALCVHARPIADLQVAILFGSREVGYPGGYWKRTTELGASGLAG